MHIKKLDMVILMQSQLEKSVEFYKKLGFELKFEIPQKWAEFIMGNVKIGLCPLNLVTKDSKDDSAPADRRSGLVFEVDDLKKFYESNKKELNFIGDPLEKVHGIMISIKDPGGNIIDLYQPTPEKLKDLVKKAASEPCCNGQCTCKVVN